MEERIGRRERILNFLTILLIDAPEKTWSSYGLGMFSVGSYDVLALQVHGLLVDTEVR